MTPFREIYLSVVIPVFNEGAALQPMLADLMRQLEDQFPGGFEVIIVDDASTDHSAEIVKGNDWPITYIRHSTRLGSGTARKTGSTLARGELCAWVDGDGTYRVADLLALVANLGLYDQMIGARNEECGDLPLVRTAVKWLARNIAGLLWFRRIPDLNSGLRVFRRKSMLPWLHLMPAGFSCTTTATLAATCYGQNVSYWPITYLPRIHGSRSKFHPLKDTLKLYKTILKLRFCCGAGVTNGDETQG